MAEKGSKERPAEERLFTVPLRREWLKASMNRRAGRSVAAIGGYLSRHMKVPEGNIRISAGINDALWIRGAGKPPARVRLKASLDASGILRAGLPDEKPPEKEEKGKKEDKQAKEEPAKSGERDAEEKLKEESRPDDKSLLKEEPSKFPAEKPKEEPVKSIEPKKAAKEPEASSKERE